MKILITGGAGFIGSHVADAYIKEGHDVVIIDNFSTGRKENCNKNAKLIECDITNKSQIEEIFECEKPDVVNHHAAQMNVRKSIEDPKYDAEINILGLVNILHISSRTKVKRFIFSSSGGAIYGPAEIPTEEKLIPCPVSPYGLSKLVGERYIQLYNELYGMQYVLLRYANVYGPRQNPHGEAGVIAIFIDQMQRNEQPTIFGDGQQTRDYVYVKDVVKANILALTKGDNQIINIGTGKETTVNHIFSELKKQMRFQKSARHGEEIRGEVRRGALKIDKANTILSWKPTVVLEQGLLYTETEEGTKDVKL